MFLFMEIMEAKNAMIKIVEKKYRSIASTISQIYKGASRCGQTRGKKIKFLYSLFY